MVRWRARVVRENGLASEKVYEERESQETKADMEECPWKVSSGYQGSEGPEVI